MEERGQCIRVLIMINLPKTAADFIDVIGKLYLDQMIKDRFEDWTVTEYDLTYTLRSTGDYMKEQHKRKELLLLIMELKDWLN